MTKNKQPPANQEHFTIYLANKKINIAHRSNLGKENL